MPTKFDRVFAAHRQYGNYGVSGTLGEAIAARMDLAAAVVLLLLGTIAADCWHRE